VPGRIKEYQEQHVRFVGVSAKIQTGHHLNTSLKHYHLIIKYKAVTSSKNPGKYEDYSVDLISTPACGRKLFTFPGPPSSQSLLLAITLIPSNRNWKRFKFTMLHNYTLLRKGLLMFLKHKYITGRGSHFNSDM